MVFGACAEHVRRPARSVVPLIDHSEHFAKGFMAKTLYVRAGLLLLLLPLVEADPLQW